MASNIAPCLTAHGNIISTSRCCDCHPVSIYKFLCCCIISVGIFMYPNKLTCSVPHTDVAWSKHHISRIDRKCDVVRSSNILACTCSDGSICITPNIWPNLPSDCSICITFYVISTATSNNSIITLRCVNTSHALARIISQRNTAIAIRTTSSPITNRYISSSSDSGRNILTYITSRRHPNRNITC